MTTAASAEPQVLTPAVLPEQREGYWLNLMLATGILLRIAVLATASPDNPDPHQEVIEYIVDHHALPVSNALNQSYHPPLYYLLMAPVWAATRNPQMLHLGSFVFSLLNLIALRRLIRHPLIMPGRAGRYIAFGLFCFLPEFVMFGEYVSNDSLAFLVGTLLFWTVVRYIELPTIGRMSAMGILVGIGLLTKGTFLLTGPVLGILVLQIERRKNWNAAITRVAVFCMIWGVSGSYKYLDNTLRVGRPIVHNLDIPTNINLVSQRPTWTGLESLYDFNLPKLMRNPVIIPRHPFSYGLLFYATFWYPHIPSTVYFWHLQIPPTAYSGPWHGYGWIGSALYATGIGVTVLFLMGVISGLRETISIVVQNPERSRPSARAMITAAAMLLVASNFAVVFAAGWRYDVWSCFQSRLCFQSILPGAVLMGIGIGMLPQRPIVRGVFFTSCAAAILLCAAYFLVELALIGGILPYGQDLRTGVYDARVK